MTTKSLLAVLLVFGLGSAAVGYARPALPGEPTITTSKAPRKSVKRIRSDDSCPPRNDPTGGCERPAHPTCFIGGEATCVCFCD
jgi:hypothetical protein